MQRRKTAEIEINKDMTFSAFKTLFNSVHVYSCYCKVKCVQWITSPKSTSVPDTYHCRT